MDDDQTVAVLAAWVHERVPIGTLMALCGTYYTPSDEQQLWMEVEAVGQVCSIDGRRCVEVTGRDIAQRVRGQEISRLVLVWLDVLTFPGVLIHPPVPTI